MLHRYSEAVLLMEEATEGVCVREGRVPVAALVLLTRAGRLAVLRWVGRRRRESLPPWNCER